MNRAGNPQTRESADYLSATEVSKYYLRASLAWIRENPGDWFRLLGRKWLMTWHAYEPYDTEDYYLYQQHSSLLASLDRVFHFGVLAPLSAAGLFLTWSDRRRLWPLYAWLLLIAAATALFVVFARYRAPMLPLLILFAAAGLVRGFDAFRERRTGRLGVAVLVLGVAGLASNAPGVHPRRPDVTSYLNHGAALAAQGRYQDDLAETAKAAEIDPDSVDVHLAAGNTLVQMGLYQEALNHYAKARDTEPDYAGAYRGVGDSLVGLNRPDLAAEQYRKALKLDSDDLAARNGLATALAQQGRLEEAVKLFAEVLKEDPDYVEALLNLGNTYASTGRLDEAAEAYERALSRSPEYVDALHNLGVIELHRGDAERAAGVLTKANKLAPDREDVRQALEAAKQLQEVKNAGSQ